ncbi:hypothetical protein ACXN5S_08125 [Pseudoroseicyclus sp. H15]
MPRPARMPRLMPGLMLVAALSLTGCSALQSSRLNPLNWFGSATQVRQTLPNGEPRPLVPEGSVAAPVDARQPIAQVTSVEVARSNAGAIVRATGLAAGQGWYNAELVRIGYEGGTLVYQFRAEPPPGATAGGAPATRQITVADALSAAELAGITGVRVQGAANAMQASR